MIRKIFAVLLASAMLLSLAACGGTGTGDNPVSPSGGKPSKSAPAVISPEAPSAQSGGVTVDVGSFVLDSEAELCVEKLADESDSDGGWKIEPYSISVGDLHELDDYITIRIPYGSDFCAAGEDPSKCVGAKYKNDATGEWEDVLFEVDSASKEVVIYTDHLSTYGVFYIENEGMRRAYITDIGDDIDYLSYEQAVSALQSYVESDGDKTPQLIKAGVAALGSITELSSTYGDLSDAADNVVSIVTFGEEQFDDLLPEKAADVLGSVGALASGIKLAKQILSSDAEDKLDLYKDTVSMMIEGGGEALTSAGGAAFGLALSGVWIFDKVIGDMFDEATAIKLEQIGEVYQYFNDEYSGGAYSARTLKDWRQIMIDVVAENPGDEDAVKTALDEEIDSYAHIFWDLGGDTLAEVEDDAGFKRIPYPTQSEIDTLTEQYKQNLYERLYPATVSVRNYFSNNAKSEYLKSLGKLKSFYNQAVTFTAKEEIEAGQASKYAGYTASFGPLSDSAVVKDWSGTVGSSGEIRTSFTLLGCLLAGSPNELRFFKPGDDPLTAAPELSVPFRITTPAVEVKFGCGPALKDILGEYSGTVTLESLKISDDAYQLYASEPSEYGEDLTQAECDSALNEMIADGEIGIAQTVSLVSDDPQSGMCSIVFVIGEDSAPTVVAASYADGVLTVSGTYGSSGSIAVKEENGHITLSTDGIVAAMSDVEEYGDMVLLYAGISFDVSK